MLAWLLVPAAAAAAVAAVVLVTDLGHGGRVAGSCVPGYARGPGAAFVPGPPPRHPAAAKIQRAARDLTPGYRLTLANRSAAAVGIAGFEVAFRGTGGTRLGYDQEVVIKAFLAAGRSFTYVEYSGVTAEGRGSGLGTAVVPAGVATCRLVTWYATPAG